MTKIFNFLIHTQTPLWMTLFLSAALASIFILWLRAYKASISATEKLKANALAQVKIEDTIKALSTDALRNNNEAFIQMAASKLNLLHSQSTGELQRRKEQFENLVTPIKETLEQMHSKLFEFEKSRCLSESKLSEQILRLQQETSSLSKALRQPHVRGRWGEVQLQRVVEMAGMLEYCDFFLQETAKGEDRRRPDMIVRLPGGKNVIVDAKTPLHSYLEAFDTIDDKERLLKLKDHARQVKYHIDELSKKSYWDQFQPTPEFVILFLPGEPFYSAALEQDGSLIERGVEHKVILATPTTLIAILRAVAYGWRQEAIAKNAQQISDAGKALYERLATFSDHLTGVKRGLEQAVKSYNQAIGSYESRVMVSARKLSDLGAATTAEIAPVEAIDLIPR